MRKANEPFPFSDDQIARLPIPEGRRVRYYDADTPYMTLIVSPRGPKSFYYHRWLKSKRRPVQRSIGRWCPAFRVHQARETAQRITKALAAGYDFESAFVWKPPIVETEVEQALPGTIRWLGEVLGHVECNAWKLLLKPAVYFLCQGAEVVYVGKSTRPCGRVGDHCPDKEFDSLFVWPLPVEDLASVESCLIETLRPRYNRNCPRRGDEPITEKTASILRRAVSEEWVAALQKRMVRLPAVALQSAAQPGTSSVIAPRSG